MAKISMHITVEAEPRRDHWACFVPEFGFTVYGETQDGARREVNVALQVLMDSFHEDLEAIERFLEKRNVSYSIQHNIEPDHQTLMVEKSHAEVLIAA